MWPAICRATLGGRLRQGSRTTAEVDNAVQSVGLLRKQRMDMTEDRRVQTDTTGRTSEEPHPHSAFLKSSNMIATGEIVDSSDASGPCPHPPHDHVPADTAESAAGTPDLKRTRDPQQHLGTTAPIRPDETSTSESYSSPAAEAIVQSRWKFSPFLSLLACSKRWSRQKKCVWTVT